MGQNLVEVKTPRMWVRGEEGMRTSGTDTEWVHRGWVRHYFTYMAYTDRATNSGMAMATLHDIPE